MALPSNSPARCGLGHSLAKHRIIILNPMSIAVQHAHEGRRFFAPAPPPRQNVACEGVGLIRLCFRGMLAAASCPGLISSREGPRVRGLAGGASEIRTLGPSRKESVAWARMARRGRGCSAHLSPKILDT